jgi:1-aminocyclopropane-1-carboxylate deaminase/D-cysteine desulfhydrase-like pyridoxal-dependent ACC family enzyme
MEEVAEEIRRNGGHPLVVPLGASTPLGALGYARAAVEMHRQMPPTSTGGSTWIVVASSSGGTLAGLAAGFTLLGRTDVRLVGVSADVSREELLATTGEIAHEALELLGVETRILDGLVQASDVEVGVGYGVETDAAREATLAWARCEGVVLDPVYTSKAAAGLVSRVADGIFATRDRVVFWHTGGSPAVFR